MYRAVGGERERERDGERGKEREKEGGRERREGWWYETGENVKRDDLPVLTMEWHSLYDRGEYMAASTTPHQLWTAPYTLSSHHLRKNFIHSKKCAHWHSPPPRSLLHRLCLILLEIFPEYLTAKQLGFSHWLRTRACKRAKERFGLRVKTENEFGALQDWF